MEMAIIEAKSETGISHSKIASKAIIVENDQCIHYIHIYIHANTLPGAVVDLK